MPTIEICGSSWPRTKSTLSRAAASVKDAEITVEIVGRGKRQRLFPRGRQGRTLGGHDKPLRRMSDRSGVQRPADFEIALGGDPLRDCLRQRGFRLRHVGAGHLADPEPVARRFQLLAQDLLVVAGDLEQVLVAHDVEIGGDDSGEDIASRPKRSARGRPARC